MSYWFMSTAVVGGTPGVTVTPITDPAAGDALLKRLLARKELPADDAEASIRWGKTSRFNLIEPEARGQPSVTVIWPDDEDEEEEEEAPPLQYDEVSREVSVIRVENPTDSEQYVMVERIESIIFRGPDGVQHQFNLNHDE